MRRTHTMRLGDITANGSRIPEKHVQLVADYIMDTPTPIPPMDVVEQFQAIGYIEEALVATDRLLKILERKGYIMFNRSTEMWSRIVEGGEEG